MVDAQGLPKNDDRYRPDIDGLRALAVLAVLFFHAAIPGFGGGYVGVDVFFVISGFLITRLVVDELERTGTVSFRRFYLRRARRLFPALFATLALTFIASTILLAPSVLVVVARTTLSALLSVSNFQFWQEAGYFNPEAELNPLLHTWSLGVEEQFYLVWPLSLLLLAKWRRQWLPAFMVLVVVASLVASEWAVRTLDSAGYYLLPFRMFELALGAMMVWAVRHTPKSIAAREILLLAGLAMVVYPVLAYSRYTPFPGLAALLPCAGTALLILAGTAPWSGWLLRNRLATGLGAISYSLYLVHWPILIIYEMTTMRETTLAERCVLLAISIAVAVAFYLFIETPFRRLAAARADAVDAPRHPNRPFLVAAATLATILAIPAVAAWRSDGWNSRLEDGSGEIASLLQGRAKEGPPRDWRIRNAVARVAVIGDSHSTRVMYGMQWWGKASRVEFVHRQPSPGCPPLLGVAVFGRRDQSAKCRKRRDAMLQQIANEKFDAVMLVARWGLYGGKLTPTNVGGGRALSLDWGDPPPLGEPDLMRSRQAFVVGLRNTVQLMQSRGKKVIFVGQVPPIGRDPYPCIERQKNAADVERHCRASTFAEARAETGWAVVEARKIANEFPALSVYNPDGMFCYQGECHITAGSRMLYADGSHLNSNGSYRLARGLGPAVGKALGLETIVSPTWKNTDATASARVAQIAP